MIAYLIFHPKCVFLYRKRQRGGSISGRLRTVSDLEDKGVIDKTLKGVIKDKIIGGDNELEEALDQFEKGDTAGIEGKLLSHIDYHVHLTNNICIFPV